MGSFPNDLGLRLRRVPALSSLRVETPYNVDAHVISVSYDVAEDARSMPEKIDSLQLSVLLERAYLRIRIVELTNTTILIVRDKATHDVYIVPPWLEDTLRDAKGWVKRNMNVVEEWFDYMPSREDSQLELLGLLTAVIMLKTHMPVLAPIPAILPNFGRAQYLLVLVELSEQLR